MLGILDKSQEIHYRTFEEMRQFHEAWKTETNSNRKKLDEYYGCEFEPLPGINGRYVMYLECMYFWRSINSMLPQLFVTTNPCTVRSLMLLG